jgi:hypothetical protein
MACKADNNASRSAENFIALPFNESNRSDLYLNFITTVTSLVDMLKTTETLIFSLP